METPIVIFWHRRDLRLHDNAGLFHALQSGKPVLPLFIFDTHILDDLEDAEDARVEFIHQELSDMKAELEQLGSSMIVRYGKPEEIWPQLLQAYEVDAVFTNRDYEPYAKTRDQKVRELLEKNGVEFHTYRDHLIFEPGEVLTQQDTPYTVYTPFSKTWNKHLESETDTWTNEDGEEVTGPARFKPFPSESLQDAFLEAAPLPMPTLSDMGFKPAGIPFPPREVKRKTIREYGKKRNFPAEEGTSRLGIHFRFGTISIRRKAFRAKSLSKSYLNELTWREFYAHILDHFPKVVSEPFRAKYSYVPWRDAEDEFERWCRGKTGYPIVDAGMRQLNETGYMHNRVRMITASFLTKHLLIDWRWGEAYFARKLLDYELASNNGGWQWAAGCGTDAAPYFRIFNPWTQREKFDKKWKYVDEWVPERETDDYPEPIVEHKFARERCLETYKKALARADEDGVS